MAKNRYLHPGIVIFLLTLAAYVGFRFWNDSHQSLLMVSADNAWTVDIHGREGVLQKRPAAAGSMVAVSIEIQNQGALTIRIKAKADGAGMRRGDAIGCYVLGKDDSRIMFCENAKGFGLPQNWFLFLGRPADDTRERLQRP